MYSETNNFFEKKETNAEKLENVMSFISEQINNEYRDEIGCDLVDGEGSIRMNAFIRKYGGPFSKEGKNDEDGVKEDKKRLENQKIEFAGGEENVENWENKKEQDPNTQAEKIITAVMHKILSKDFLVLRTAEFDDYLNGVDNLIINKETGEVVGAFDEVYDSFHQEDVDIEENKKWEKIVKKNKGNNNRVRYGVTFENQENETKITRKPIDDLPVFFLSINKQDFTSLLNNLQIQNMENPNQYELQVFDKMIESIEEQKEKLLEQNIKESVRNKLENFDNSLRKMKESRKQFE
jgi:hypothetical protein